jgi:hypothetical protein
LRRGGDALGTGAERFVACLLAAFTLHAAGTANLNGTSRHLHFDVQVFTRDGWIWVNPYVTLISAYERLIRGRGPEMGPQVPPSAAMAHALPQHVNPLEGQEGSED